jgi:hypothetical protein
VAVGRMRSSRPWAPPPSSLTMDAALAFSLRWTSAMVSYVRRPGCLAMVRNRKLSQTLSMLAIGLVGRLIQ